MIEGTAAPVSTWTTQAPPRRTALRIITYASSRGFGELILAAGHPRTLIVGLGGTANVDGGAGLLEVLSGLPAPGADGEAAALEERVRAMAFEIPGIQFDEYLEDFAEGGGVVSIYYHPCEFVHKEFWDGVNFRNGANPPREQWKQPPAKTAEESRVAYEVFEGYVRFIKRFPEVQFVTATDLAAVYRDGARGRKFAASEIREIAAAWSGWMLSSNTQTAPAPKATELGYVLTDLVRSTASVWGSSVTALMILPLSFHSCIAMKLNEARLLIGPLKLALNSFKWNGAFWSA